MPCFSATPSAYSFRKSCSRLNFLAYPSLRSIRTEATRPAQLLKMGLESPHARQRWELPCPNLSALALWRIS